jgi:hypothetical protein
MTSESKDLVKVESVKGVDITPVITEMVEYSKDQATCWRSRINYIWCSS